VRSPEKAALYHWPNLSLTSELGEIELDVEKVRQLGEAGDISGTQ
jgi:hypothetical protein